MGSTPSMSKPSSVSVPVYNITFNHTKFSSLKLIFIASNTKKSVTLNEHEEYSPLVLKTIGAIFFFLTTIINIAHFSRFYYLSYLIKAEDV